MNCLPTTVSTQNTQYQDVYSAPATHFQNGISRDRNKDAAHDNATHSNGRGKASGKHKKSDPTSSVKPAGQHRDGKARGSARRAYAPDIEDVRVAPQRPNRPVNANHLLGFQYSSGRPARGGARSSTTPNAGNRGGGHKWQLYDRNKFLQANFRFLVSDAVDMAVFTDDADKMFDWEDVVQVEMTTCGAVKCPVSLDSPPVCPHITPCGHVFSLHSLMQHLINVGGDSLRRAAPCPLCFTPLVARELRLVKINIVNPLRVGDMMSLTLLSRPKSSIIPTAVLCAPGSPSTPSSSSPQGAQAPSLAWNSNLESPLERNQLIVPESPFDTNRFAKFITIGDATSLWAQAASELATYAAKVVSEGGLEAAIEAPFVYAALDALAVRAARWVQHRLEAPELRNARPGMTIDTTTAAAAAAVAEAEVRRMFIAASSTVKADAESPQRSRRSSLQPGEDFPPLPSSNSKASADFPQLSKSNSKAEAEIPQPPATTAPLLGGVEGVGVSQARGLAAQTQGTGVTGTEGVGVRRQVSAAASGGALGPELGDEVSQAAGSAQEPRSSRKPVAGAGLNFFEPAFSDDDSDEALNGEAGDGVQDRWGEGSHTPGPGDQHVGGVDELGSSPPGLNGTNGADVDLLGTSPTNNKLNMVDEAGHFYFYQCSDGRWVFLHSVNLRCLLEHHGAHLGCPTTITAPVLELEDVMQSHEARKRWRFLSHLPLGATFQLVELDLGALLPQASLARFHDELAMREKRRQRRAADEARALERERAALHSAEEARRGPSVAELRAMPALPTSASFATSAYAAAAMGWGLEWDGGGPSSDEAAAALSPSPAGVSFASIAKLGYAATGPTLGSSPPSGSALPTAGAWANKSAVSALTSTIRQAAQPTPTNAAPAPSALSPPTTPLMTSLGRVPVPMRPGPSASAWSSTSGVATVKAPGPHEATMKTGMVGALSEPDAGTRKSSGKKGTLLFATASRKY